MDAGVAWPGVLTVRQLMAVTALMVVLGLIRNGAACAAELRLGPAFIESKDYVIDSDTDPVLARTVADHLDGFHAALERAFAGRLPAPSGRFTVRYAKDRASFLAYGAAHCANFNRAWHGYFQAPSATAGGELVAYHLGANHGVLFHEAFHQAMQRTFPQIRSWPRWFDEGLADFVARGHFEQGGYLLPRTLATGDLVLARDALSAQRLVPLATLLRLDLAAWNGEGQMLHYAEGYLLAHVLMTAEHPPLAGLVGRFLTKLAEGQDYEVAYAAEVVPHLAVIDRAWLAVIRDAR